VDALKTETNKTKEAAKIFSNLKLNSRKDTRKTLLLLDKIDNNLKLSLANLNFLGFNLAKDTNVYEVLAARKLVITRDALGILTKRIKG
jgi:large subunit ribosomal protein L4